MNVKNAQVSRTFFFALLMFALLSFSANIKLFFDNEYYRSLNKGEDAKSFIMPVSASKSITDFGSIIKPVNAAELKCLADNIYHEAANQSLMGKMAVGQVVMNRMKNSNYPNTACGVVYQGSRNNMTFACQFSWTCDGKDHPIRNTLQYQQSKEVAWGLLALNVPSRDITEGATNYHADHVKPDWAAKLTPVAKVDQHIFYRH